FNPDIKLPATVKSISTLPTAPGKFETLVALETGDRAELMPGMATTVHFVPYMEKEAIIVPAGAVYEEDDQQYVDLKKNGQRAKHRVTTGRTHAGQTEIIEGLSVGNEIFTAPAGASPSIPEPASTKGGDE